MSDVSRRDFLKITGGLAAAGAGGAFAQTGGTGRSRGGDGGPIDPPQLENPDVGDPVSQTVVAQEEGPHVPGEPPPKVGYAVLGLGKFAAGQILPSFGRAQRAELRAVVSGDRGKAEAFAKHYRLDPQRAVYTYDDFDRIADDDRIDVVYVITPPALHRTWTERAAAAGKHVLSEKPMAPTPEDCQAMIDACESAGRKLMIAYRVHYEPYNRQVMAWSDQQKFGPIRQVVTEHTQDVGGVQQWRLDRRLAGGGCLFDLGIYGLQAQLYLTNEYPTHVSAMINNPPDDPRFREVEGNIAWQLRFPSGTLAIGNSSYCAASANRIKAIAEEGWYELDPATSYTGQRLFFGRNKGDQQARHQLTIPHESQFANEMDHFARCITEDRQPRTPGQMGLRDVRLMRRIYEAAETGRTLEV